MHKTTVTKAQKTAGSQRPAPQPKIWTRNYTIMCLATFLYWCSAQMQMPILPKYASLLGVDVQYIGLTSTSFTMVALAMRPFAGRECDRRNRKHVLIAGLFLLVVATSNLFFAGTFALILFLRVLQGAGWAASSTASNTIVADLVPAECRGEGIGYYGLFPTLAMALAPLVGLSLLDSYGFPYVVAVGTVASVLALVTSMFLRLEYTAPPRSGEEVQPVLFDKRAVRPAVIMGILAFSYASLTTFLPLAAEQRGVGPIGIFFTFSAIGIMIARLRVGRYYDAQGPQRIIIFSLLALVVALELIAFASTLSTFLICGLIFGIGFGSLQPTLLAVAVQGIEPQRRGAVNGTVMGAFDLGVGMGAFLLGQVVNNWGYAVMYMGTSCIPLAGLFLYMYWERKNAGRRNGRKGFSER